MLQLFDSMFCKNVARLAVARGCHTWIRSLATAKQAIFLQNIISESCSKFHFKQYSLKILILLREYMEMCFHGNQNPWAIKHPFISLYFKYQSLRFICLSVMNSPVFPSLDDIYCTMTSNVAFNDKTGSFIMGLTVHLHSPV